MRIVGGAWRGTPLAELGAGDPAAQLRPTTDKVRESLFNLLHHGPYPPLEGARVLDLFAGTGALGLEALSRGAAAAHFVDNSPTACALLRTNIAKLNMRDRATLSRRDATRLAPPSGAPFTLVFLDPPYGRDLGAPALTAAGAGGWLAPNALVVWEEGAPLASAPEGLTLLDQRRYGTTHIALLST
ncbi:MAG: 16S rRNA (guanine(966)-N(2))-methyltransferase RsmD [Pseudomonadota bacterium]